MSEELGELSWSVNVDIQRARQNLKQLADESARIKQQLERPIRLAASRLKDDGGRLASDPGRGESVLREKLFKRESDFRLQNSKRLFDLEEQLIRRGRPTAPRLQRSQMINSPRLDDDAEGDPIAKGFRPFAAMLAVREVSKVVQELGRTARTNLSYEFARDESARNAIARQQLESDPLESLNLAMSGSRVGDVSKLMVGLLTPLGRGALRGGFMTVGGAENTPTGKLAEGQASEQNQDLIEELQKGARAGMERAAEAGLGPAFKRLAGLRFANDDLARDEHIEESRGIGPLSGNQITARTNALRAKLQADTLANTGEILQTQFIQHDDHLMKQAQVQSNQLVAGGGSQTAAQRIMLNAQLTHDAEAARRTMIESRGKPDAPAAVEAYMDAMNLKDSSLAAFDRLAGQSHFKSFAGGTLGGGVSGLERPFKPLGPPARKGGLPPGITQTIPKSRYGLSHAGSSSSVSNDGRHGNADELPFHWWSSFVKPQEQSGGSVKGNAGDLTSLLQQAVNLLQQIAGTN